jgi:hypothetical protein
MHTVESMVWGGIGGLIASLLFILFVTLRGRK